MEKDILCKHYLKKVGAAILIEDRADFRARKDIEGALRDIGSLLREDIIILNMYAPNNRASNYMRQKLIELRRETDEPTIMVGDFNTPLSEMRLGVKRVGVVWGCWGDIGAPGIPGYVHVQGVLLLIVCGDLTFISIQVLGSRDFGVVQSCPVFPCCGLGTKLESFGQRVVKNM